MQVPLRHFGPWLHFFVALARRLEQTGSIQQRALVTAYPPDFQARIVPEPYVSLEDHQTAIADRILSRIAQLESNPVWANSDEIDFALEGPRSMLPDILICPIAVWDSVQEELFYLDAPPPNVQPYRHVQWIIKENDHWILAEAYRSNGQVLFFLTSGPQTAGRLLPLIQKLRTDLGGNTQRFILHCRAHDAVPGMCGFLIVAEIYARLGIAIPPLSHSQEAELTSSPYADRLLATWNRACHAWTQVNASPHVQTLAQVLRRWLLLRITRNRFPGQIALAGAQADMDTSSPCRTSSPSQPSSGLPLQQIQCRSMTPGRKLSRPPRLDGKT